jgi:predicted transcriptional regulator
MLIEEIYNPRPRTISADKTIGEAVHSMFEQCCNGYIVVDKRDHVVGILSLQDVAGKLLPPEFRENTHMTQAMYRKGFFEELCQEIKGRSVADVMRTDFISVDLKADILTVLSDFLQNDLYIIPVIEQDHLIGVLTRTEVRKAIVKGMDSSSTQD